MNFFSIFFGLFVANEYKVFWLTATNAPTDNFISRVGSIGSVFNGLRFVWSGLLDHYSYKRVYGFLLCIEIVLAATFNLVLEHKWLYAVWICLGYWCLGGHFTLAPNEMKKVFGSKTTQLYSYLYTYAGMTGVIECVLQIFVMQASNLHLFFYLYGGFAFVSLMLLLFVYESDPWM
jgi:hypothetical protein